MGKVLMVLSDGLRNDVAEQSMGYLEHLVESKQASRYTVVAELPTLSRPLYETLHTGVTVSEHGVTHNRMVRRSRMPNVFEQAVKNGRTTAAAAYYWFSELYIRAPYDYVADREVDDPSQWIQHGRFYTEDAIPDREVFAAGASLAYRYQPDYLLVHPMGMDYAGTTHGSDSAEYRNNAIFQDMILADLIPRWREMGYTVLVTADHGITNDRMHGGKDPGNRHVPLYLVGASDKGKGVVASQVYQLQIAPTLCRLLGVPVPLTMKRAPIR